MSRLVTRSDLGDQIFDILRERITRIQLAPGERLDIRGLAEELGTSAIPVRDALKRLGERGLVTSMAGPGYNVIALSESDMESVSEFRMVLELLAVETSIDRIPTEVLSDLVGRNERLFPLVEKLNTSEMVDDVDVELHTGCIVGYASNRYLKDTYDRLYDLISIAKNWLHRYPDVIAEHRAILESMLRRDLEATKKTLTDHLKKTSVECLRAMELKSAEGSLGDGSLGNAQEGSG
jgi:DNA-binding GntR family transcriptional regulator